MFFDAKTVIVFLILITSFVYFRFALEDYNQVFLVPPPDFGKVIGRIIFDDTESITEIVFVGDVMLARDVERLLNHFGNSYPFAAIKAVFSEKFVVGNFEAAIPEIHEPTPDYTTRFSVNPVSLDSLVNAKFTHWSLANNHTFDFHRSGLDNTKAELELRGFTTFGNPNEVSSSSLTQLVVNQKQLALVAVNTVNTILDLDTLKRTIDYANTTSDLVIVYIHWGDEYVQKHNKFQENLAHVLIDEGADLIIGHHPHVVQDIEQYKNRLIFYSLGNFVFDQYFSPEVQTGLTLLVKPQINNVLIELIPVSSSATKIQPQILNDVAKSQFLASLASFSSEQLQAEIITGLLKVNF